MAADTATFNDSIPFINGMLIVPVVSLTSSSDIPFDSLPRMNTLVFFNLNVSRDSSEVGQSA